MNDEVGEETLVSTRNGFELGHELVELFVSKAKSVQEADDAVYIFNKAYGVVRSQLETFEKINYYGRDGF